MEKKRIQESPGCDYSGHTRNEEKIAKGRGQALGGGRIKEEEKHNVKLRGCGTCS